ncbi:MAG: bifunctional glycosyltransferase family 2/GtrA family protein [Lachnospiraceae bacterium]|nr:bifunctional glycosyltransferase family 2/GtrA family protein [Lachnospiraceae bacterium]
MKKTVILIPALDPPASFPSYVEELHEAGFSDVIVVDDGSSDKTIFEELSHKGCAVLTHAVNEGKGQALKTGLAYYRDHYDFDEYAGVITADSDGQHLCADVKKLADAMTGGEERLILGSRDFTLPQVPARSRFGNQTTARVFRIFFRMKVGDTQTGLRGIPNALVEACLAVRGKRFEYETAMLLDVGKQSGILEIPIETVYLDENKGTHFNTFTDSARIYWIIFGTFFRFALSGVSSAIVDLVMFAFFSKLILPEGEHRILAATYLARVISASFNFVVNRNIVFKSEKKVSVTAVEYVLLCVAQAYVSAFLVKNFSLALSAEEVVVKVFVDLALFFVSFFIQKRLIFKR